MFKSRSPPLSDGRWLRNNENTLTEFFKIFFSRTTEQISTYLGTKNLFVKGIQICSNEGLHHCPRGDNNKRWKIYWRNLKENLLQNHWTNFNQNWRNVSLCGGNSSFINNQPFSSQKRNTDFFIGSRSNQAPCHHVQNRISSITVL